MAHVGCRVAGGRFGGVAGSGDPVGASAASGLPPVCGSSHSDVVTGARRQPRGDCSVKAGPLPSAPVESAGALCAQPLSSARVLRAPDTLGEGDISTTSRSCPVRFVASSCLCSCCMAPARWFPTWVLGFLLWAIWDWRNGPVVFRQLTSLVLAPR